MDKRKPNPKKRAGSKDVVRSCRTKRKVKGKFMVRSSASGSSIWSSQICLACGNDIFGFYNTCPYFATTYDCGAKLTVCETCGWELERIRCTCQQVSPENSSPPDQNPPEWPPEGDPRDQPVQENPWTPAEVSF